MILHRTHAILFCSLRYNSLRESLRANGRGIRAGGVWGLLLLFSSLGAHTLMIAPAGDAKDPGRKLAHGYERGVTLQLAEALKAKLKEHGVTVHISRSAGEEVPELGAASYANRAGVDKFVSLHVYHAREAKPHIDLFGLVYNPLVDGQLQHDEHAFVPLCEAHFGSVTQSKNFGERVHELLGVKENERLLSCSGLVRMPFKPLCGVVAPAIGVEIGLSSDEQWESLVAPLARAIAGTY